MVRPLSILRMEGGKYQLAGVWQTVAVKSLTSDADRHWSSVRTGHDR
jgi:hypothetical protein